MRFIEAIFRETRDEIENGVGGLLRDPVDELATLDEARAFLGHFLPVLLAHRAPEKISLAQRIARENMGGALNLLLVDNDPIGFRTNLLKQWMSKLDGLAIFLRAM